jgi:transcriptional regulator with XRE-family HTH domain
MTITPQEIRDRAYAARISVNALLRRAGVYNTTLWRWEQPEPTEPRPLTLARIVDALDAAERERQA